MAIRTVLQKEDEVLKIIPAPGEPSKYGEKITIIIPDVEYKYPDFTKDFTLEDIEKFADNFSHRDFLGAIMNLGIEREVVGDIAIKGKKAYIFCTVCSLPEQLHVRLQTGTRHPSGTAD